MKVDLSKEIKTLDGKSMKVDGEKTTIGRLSANCLMNSSSKNYLDKVDLAKRIIAQDKDGEIALKTEEINLIKEAVKEMNLTAQLVYQFEQAIDPTEEPEEEKPKDK